MTDQNNKPNFYDLYQKVGTIDGKLDGVINHLDKINGRLNSHSKKIDVLENTTATIKGKAAGAGAVAGFIAGAISVIIAIVTFFRKGG